MQVIGRLCEGCGDAVTKLGDGDGCGSCDVVICGKCLAGTKRCPSCQQPFSETREHAPRVERGSDARLDRGGRQARAIAISVLGAFVLHFLLGRMTASMLLLHGVVFGLLFLQLFRGRAWARWGLVVLTGLNAFSHGAVLLESPTFTTGALGLVFVWSAIVLAASEPLARFLREQRLRNP